jgi:hypothetical protein
MSVNNRKYIKIFLEELRNIFDHENPFEEFKATVEKMFNFSVYVKRNPVRATTENDGMCLVRCEFQLKKRTEHYRTTGILLPVTSLKSLDVDLADPVQREEFLVAIEKNIKYLSDPLNRTMSFASFDCAEYIETTIVHLKTVKERIENAVETKEDMKQIHLSGEKFGGSFSVSLLFRGYDNESFPLMYFEHITESDFVNSNVTGPIFYRLQSADCSSDRYVCFPLSDIRKAFAQKLDNAIVLQSMHFSPLQMLGSEIEIFELNLSFQIFCTELYEKLVAWER